MTSISQNNRYLPRELNTKYYAVKLYRTGTSVRFVCRRDKISKSSLMRWNKKFDSTKKSLIDKSHKPIRIHPIDSLLNELKIKHQLIRSITPRHNGKVEWSHRNNQNRFYNFLLFYSYEDLKKWKHT